MAVLALALAVGACSGADLVNALTPRGGYQVARDIAYGPHPRQRLDLYTPSDVAPDKPLIVFFYGGRWQEGAKEDFLFVGQALAARGYPVAIPDYRLYPEVRWRGFLADGATALAFLAGREGARPLVVAGHSAGAYMAAMLTLNQGLRRAAGVPPCAVAGGVGLAGPYNFLPLKDADIVEIFGPGVAGLDTQPVSYVDRSDPPMLLLTGADDAIVDPRNAENLASHLKAVGVPAAARSYPEVGHIELVASFAAPLRVLAPTLADIDAFAADVPTAAGCGGPDRR